MRKRGTWLITAAVLACTACLGESGKLEIRSIDRGLKSGQEPVPFRIAEARGHLALGNVALALEGFRKAARDDPASTEALVGIAHCYDRMGRFDLSRRNYEMALAIAPRDEGLLAAFGASLAAQGRSEEAASVHRELAALAASAAASAQVESAVAAQLPELPASAAPVGQSVTIALPPLEPAERIEPRPADSTALAAVPVGKSVTIALPPARPISTTRTQAPPEVAQPSTVRRPRLERVSLTEVALVTGDGPRWKRPLAAPAPAVARAAAPRPMELRILNAARVDRLAARTRTYLLRHGWQTIVVGDAAAVRSRSLIIYPKGKQAAANRLSARLGFATEARSNVRQLTILLGKDATTVPVLRQRG